MSLHLIQKWLSTFGDPICNINNNTYKMHIKGIFIYLCEPSDVSAGVLVG